MCVGTLEALDSTGGVSAAFVPATMQGGAPETEGASIPVAYPLTRCR
jgi:hypothetical protein